MVESRLFGKQVGCPFCKAKFAAPNLFRQLESSETPNDDESDDYMNDDDYYYYD